MLINCPECGREVSSHASSCTHCGYPLPTDKTHLIAKKQKEKEKEAEELKEWYKRFEEEKSSRTCSDCIFKDGLSCNAGHWYPSGAPNCSDFLKK